MPGQRCSTSRLQTGILVQYEPATHGYNWAAQEGRLQYEPGAPFVGDERFRNWMRTSVLVAVLACVATWIGFSTLCLRKGGTA